MKAEFRIFLNEKNCLEKFETTLFEEAGFTIDDFCKITNPHDYVLSAFKWKGNDSKCWTVLNNRWHSYVDVIISNDHNDALKMNEEIDAHIEGLRLNEEVNGRLVYYNGLSENEAHNLAITENKRR